MKLSHLQVVNPKKPQEEMQGRTTAVFTYFTMFYIF